MSTVLTRVAGAWVPTDATGSVRVGGAWVGYGLAGGLGDPQSLYTTETPANETFETPGPTVGTVIVIAVAGLITHLKWFCPRVLPSNASTLPFVLYDATTQDVLARVVPGLLLAEAWNTVALPAPVPVIAGQRVIAAVYTLSQYGYTGGYFLAGGRTVGALTAPASTADPVGNGRFRSGSDGFPGNTFNGNNYWTDVVFRPLAG
jgi:hypothetical protein